MDLEDSYIKIRDFLFTHAVRSVAMFLALLWARTYNINNITYRLTHIAWARTLHSVKLFSFIEIILYSLITILNTKLLI